METSKILEYKKEIETFDYVSTLWYMGIDSFKYHCLCAANIPVSDAVLPIESPLDILVAYSHFRKEKEEYEFDDYMTRYMDNVIQEMRYDPNVEVEDAGDDENLFAVEQNNLLIPLLERETLDSADLDLLFSFLLRFVEHEVRRVMIILVSRGVKIDEVK